MKHDAADFLCVASIHLLDPTARSWAKLAALALRSASRSTGSPTLPAPSVLETTAYADRASLAFSALCSATDVESDGPVRRMLAEWLVVFAERTASRPPTATPPALAGMSDRHARRLLGTRAFLRGRDLHCAGRVHLECRDDVSAAGRVEDWVVSLRLVPDGLEHTCTCTARRMPTCVHVAALFIAARSARS
jgi:hypothetical protein